jgi:hypothetical protein
MLIYQTFLRRISRSALIALVIIPATALAVDYGGVGGTPANPVASNPRTKSIFVYDLTLGQRVADGVKVFNNTNVAKTIALGAVDSIVSSDGGFACAQAVDPKNDVGAWTSLAQQQVRIDSHASKIVPFSVMVPNNADVGEHDGCITIQDVSDSSANQTGSGVVLGFRSALRMIVTIPGVLTKRLEFTNIGVVRPVGSRAVTIRPALKNTGNVSVDANLVVEARNILGIRVFRNGGTYPVLPRTIGSWNYDFKTSMWGGWYSIRLGAGLELLLVLIFGVGAWWLMVRRRHHERTVRLSQEYVVRKGDSLEVLAQKFGSDWKLLIRINKLKPPYTLKKGQKLKIPLSPQKDSKVE